MPPSDARPVEGPAGDILRAFLAFLTGGVGGFPAAFSQATRVTGMPRTEDGGSPAGCLCDLSVCQTGTSPSVPE
jgi:hypothetical protein